VPLSAYRTHGWYVKLEPSKLMLKLRAYPYATGGKRLQLGS